MSLAGQVPRFHYFEQWPVWEKIFKGRVYRAGDEDESIWLPGDVFADNWTLEVSVSNDSDIN